MDSEEQLQHVEVLIWIQERLHPNSREVQRLANAIAHVKFVRNEEGVCHFISDLVLVNTDIQRIVTSLSEQLNTKFLEKRQVVEKFLTKHGIQTKTSAEKILTYVKTHLVVPHIASKEDREKVTKFMKALSAEDRHLEDVAFLQELSSLKFLPRAVPAWVYREEIVPFDPTVPICFNESVEMNGTTYALSLIHI